MDDFYDALAQALGSVDWHGRNPDAFLESMVYYTSLNEVKPPYQLVIAGASDQLRPYLLEFGSWVQEARNDRRQDPEWGDDMDVSVILT